MQRINIVDISTSSIETHFSRTQNFFSFLNCIFTTLMFNHVSLMARMDFARKKLCCKFDLVTF